MHSLKTRVTLSLIACLAIAAGAVRAAEPAYLAEMPTPAEVVEQVKGSDAFDTAARRYVAFTMLFAMTMEMMGNRYVAGEMTPAEKAVRDAYNDNIATTQADLLASLPESQREVRPDSDYGRWRALVDRYCCSKDANTTDELLETFFSPEFRATYAPIRAATEARARALFAPPPPQPEAPPVDPMVGVVVVLGIVIYVVFYISGAARGHPFRRRGD